MCCLLCQDVIAASHADLAAPEQSLPSTAHAWSTNHTSGQCTERNGREKSRETSQERSCERVLTGHSALGVGAEAEALWEGKECRCSHTQRGCCFNPSLLGKVTVEKD